LIQKEFDGESVLTHLLSQQPAADRSEADDDDHHREAGCQPAVEPDLAGDCIEIMLSLPEASVDLILPILPIISSCAATCIALTIPRSMRSTTLGPVRQLRGLRPFTREWLRPPGAS
jgi:hypothetical protein